MTVATKKLLLDVREPGEGIRQITAGKSLPDYSRSRMLRRAVEREFEIIGEAPNRLAQIDPPTAAAVSQLRKIVDFRNRIIHGYDAIDDIVVWGCDREESSTADQRDHAVASGGSCQIGDAACKS